MENNQECFRCWKIWVDLIDPNNMTPKLADVELLSEHWEIEIGSNRWQQTKLLVDHSTTDNRIENTQNSDRLREVIWMTCVCVICIYYRSIWKCRVCHCSQQLILSFKIATIRFSEIEIHCFSKFRSWDSFLFSR